MDFVAGKIVMLRNDFRNPYSHMSTLCVGEERSFNDNEATSVSAPPALTTTSWTQIARLVKGYFQGRMSLNVWRSIADERLDYIDEGSDEELIGVYNSSDRPYKSK